MVIDVENQYWLIAYRQLRLTIVHFVMILCLHIKILCLTDITFNLVQRNLNKNLI